MIEEMEALQKNDTWELLNFLEGNKIVGYRWVLIVKHKASGFVERFKVRLVVNGYTQTYEVDYQESFAPTVKINTIWVLFLLPINLARPFQWFYFIYFYHKQNICIN